MRIGSHSDIPQDIIDMFSEQAKTLELEAKRFDDREIAEIDLSLSLLSLDVSFINEHVIAGLDPYRSNAGLVDPGTAVALRTPSSSLGERSSEHLKGPSPHTGLEAAPATSEPAISKENPVIILQ